MNTRSYLFSVLIAGVLIGLFGNLPLLNLINCALCIFVWLGGALAVVFYRRFEHGMAYPSTGQAAGLGAVAGVIGALIGAPIYLITSSISNVLFAGLMRFLQAQGDLPFRTGGIANMLGGMAVFLCFDLLLYPIFGALGAMIAASVMKKPAPAE